MPLNEKWDPLNLGSTDAKMERYTAVEIKHGRVAMIATLGYFMPEMVRFPGCENYQHGLGALSSIPVEGWVQLFAFIGAHEVFIKPRQGGMGSYDLGFGTEFLENVDEYEIWRRQTVERNNGRLAMVAILGMMWQDGTFAKTPIQMLVSDGWFGPPVDFLVKDIPQCAGGTLCARKPVSSNRSRVATRAEAKTGYFAAQADSLSPYQFADELYVPPPSEPMPCKMSASMPFLEANPLLEDYVGGEKGFDPLDMACSPEQLYWNREAELKHGRICMLASVGWMATDSGLRFQGDMFQGVSTIEAHNKMIEAGPMITMLMAVGICELYGWFLLRETLGGKLDRDAGDFFIGKQFLPKDPEQERLMRLKELENGRLAMLAFSGMVTAGVATEKPWPFIDL